MRDETGERGAGHEEGGPERAAGARPMRILVVVEAFPNLTETFVLQQITGLIDRGHDVRIFATGPLPGDPPVHPDFERYGLSGRTVYRGDHRRGRIRRMAGSFRDLLGRKPLAALRCLNVPKYGRLVTSGRLVSAASRVPADPRFDILLAHFGPNGQLAAALLDVGVLEGVLVTIFHGKDVGNKSRFTLRRRYWLVFRRSGLLLSASRHFRNRLLGAGLRENRIRVHHMGIDSDYFRPVPRDPSRGTVEILSVGRLVAKKGFATSITALAALPGDAPPWRYHLVGDGPLREDLREAADRLGIRERVVFHGWQDRTSIRDLLRESEILLAPSVTTRKGDVEACPVVISEALSCGLAVIASAHGGIPEMIQHDRSGILFPEGDHMRLSREVLRLLRSPALRRTLAENGRRHILENWDARRLNDRLESILAGLLPDEEARG